jgi:hypothetical protein
LERHRRPDLTDGPWQQKRTNFLQTLRNSSSTNNNAEKLYMYNEQRGMFGKLL